MSATTGVLRMRRHGLLWFGVADDVGDRWSITDPLSAELADACSRLMSSTIDGQGTRSSDIYTVLRVVSDYQHLTTYELGVEHIVRKLRFIWRGLREPNPLVRKS